MEFDRPFFLYRYRPPRQAFLFPDTGCPDKHLSSQIPAHYPISASITGTVSIDKNVEIQVPCAASDVSPP